MIWYGKYGYRLCITDTKGSHADLTDEYAAIPKEMKLVAKYFGKEVLCGISINDVLDNITDLRKNLETDVSLGHCILSMKIKEYKKK